MPESAQVRSIDALEGFRSDLILFLSKARPVVDDITSELRRTQLWLETDRLPFWQREVIRRTRILENAQQALLSARIATFKDVTPIEQNAVRVARQSLDEAEAKLKTVKRWLREFVPKTEILVRQISALEFSIAQDIPRAIHWLSDAVRALEAYADVRRVTEFTDSPATPSTVDPPEPLKSGTPELSDHAPTSLPKDPT